MSGKREQVKRGKQDVWILQVGSPNSPKRHKNRRDWSVFSGEYYMTQSAAFAAQALKTRTVPGLLYRVVRYVPIVKTEKS